MKLARKLHRKSADDGVLAYVEFADVEQRRYARIFKVGQTKKNRAGQGVPQPTPEGVVAYIEG